MAEYIEREALLKDIENDSMTVLFDKTSAIHHVKNQPAADVAEVRHGKWNEVVGMAPPELHGLHFCSLCSEFALQKKHKEYLSNYCPNCGAEMSRGDE